VAEVVMVASVVAAVMVAVFVVAVVAAVVVDARSLAKSVANQDTHRCGVTSALMQATMVVMPNMQMLPPLGTMLIPNGILTRGATDHITSELDKLTMREKYGGSDQVHTASGSGMPISHLGQTTIHAHNRDLILKDVLHIPDASKNLISVHKFTSDNNVFLEFHPWYFLSVVKPTMARWHFRLGHASLPIVQRVVSKNNLSCLKENSHESVCDACMKAKSHQLPFGKSDCVSKAPLELVFSDV
jgi:hypothetical protein